MNSQFDLFRGRELKQEGMTRAVTSRDEWKAEALAILRRKLPYETEFMADSFRPLVAPEIGDPGPHVWGPLALELAKLGVIRPTGEFRSSRMINNHAHHYRVYRRSRYPAR